MVDTARCLGQRGRVFVLQRCVRLYSRRASLLIVVSDTNHPNRAPERPQSDRLGLQEGYGGVILRPQASYDAISRNPMS